MPAGVHAQSPNYKELFQQQVLRSCEAQPQYLKEARDLLQEDAPAESRSFSLELDKSENPPACLLTDELVYAFDRYFDSPRQREFFEISRQGDTLMALPLPEKAEAAELQQQKVLLSADGNTLRFVESHLLRDYWLYSTRVRIQVAFDENGRYLWHQLDVGTEVVLVGKGLKAQIRGKAEY